MIGNNLNCTNLNFFNVTKKIVNMGVYDVIQKSTSSKVAMFEKLSYSGDSSLTIVRVKTLDFKEHLLTVPSSMLLESIVKSIVIELFPEEDTDDFYYR